MTSAAPPKRRLDSRLLSEARAAPGSLAASLSANAILGVVIVAQALLLSQIIDRAFLGGESLDQLASLLVALAMVIGLRAGVTYAASIAAARLALTAKNALRQRFVAQLYALGPAYSRAERSGDLVLSATEGVEKLDGYFRDYLPGMFTAIFLPLLILLVVLPLDLLTFAVLLITAPLIPFFMILIGRAAGALAQRQFFEMRFLGAHFLDVMQGLITLKLFNRSRHQIETIRRITDEFRIATMRVLRVAFLSALTLELLATLSVAIVAVEIGLRLLDGGIGFGHALFLLVIAPEFYLPLRALGAKFHNATEGKAAAERLYAVLDTPLVEPPTVLQSLPQRMAIRFEHVAISYDAGARPALRDLSFAIEPGERVALVGASGGGKTTIANLMLGFVQPDAGQISVAGVDLRTLPLVDWRARIAWVSQSPYLFNATVAANLRLSRPDATDADLIAAATAAGAHEFITQLPDGYQTLCGERGLRLSGGQAQRITLARAFLRDAPLLILDEPTSQLDPDGEAEVIASLNRLAQGRTVLLITHRLSAALDADRILMIDAGEIVERGTHADLLALNGAYARLAASFAGDADEA